MSYDFFTPRICPHEVAFEKLALDASRSHADFPRPPSNRQVEVYIDGVQVPPGGLYSYPELPFSRSGPYRIKKGVNDKIYFRLGFEPPKFIELISGSISAKDLARDLKIKIPELKLSVKRNRVVITSRESGRRTGFQFVDPRWTDSSESLKTTAVVLKTYETLGIIPGRAARGRIIFPGWFVENEPLDPTQRDRRLRFHQPLRNEIPLIEVSYITNQVNCRRCHGTRIEFDYQIENNSYIQIRDTDLLAQEFDKFLFTKIGSHWKWTWLGSGLIDRIGGKGSTAQASASAVITIDVQQAFITYQDMKNQQDTRVPQANVSDAEYPLQLAGVDVELLPDDPTIAIVNTTIVSRSREFVPLKRIVGNPNPFTLAGDPVQNIRLQPGMSDFRFRG